VIAALAKHDIGYHTDFHSVHPTPSEYSRNLGWVEGAEAFLRREGQGLEDVRAIFARPISCYGQPGSSWTPQSYAALREWKVPVYLDDTRQLGLEDLPFWYGGALNVLNLEGYTTRASLESDEGVREGCRGFEEIRARVEREGGGLISIYYHPCEWVHEQFWDGVNFAKGANPPREEWKLPPQKPAAETERWFARFEDYLDCVRKSPGVKIVVASELSDLYRDRAYEGPFSRSEILEVARGLSGEVGFLRVGARTLSAAEALFLVARAFVRAAEVGRVPETVALEFAYGPADSFRTVETAGKGGAGEGAAESARAPSGGMALPAEPAWSFWVEATRDFLAARARTGRMPSEVWVGGRAVDPVDFAASLSRALLALATEGKAPARWKISGGTWTAGRYVADDSPDLWGWVIFPEGFRAPRMMALARLQAWTLKPAVLRKE
jgi:hypothetical protein